jgi:hypothetical protein
MRTVWALAIGAALFAPLALARDPGPATVSCESQVAGYVFCRTDTSRGVTLRQQLSALACFYGDTWGYDKGGIWVSNGCGAVFALGPSAAEDPIRERAQAGGASALARDLANAQPRKRALPPAAESGARAFLPLAAPQTVQPQIVVCESKQYRPQVCPATIGRHVEMRRKLGHADCRFNATWGYGQDAIWVRDGCRAEFTVY